VRHRADSAGRPRRSPGGTPAVVMKAIDIEGKEIDELVLGGES
jgi:hypothetical protein